MARTKIPGGYISNGAITSDHLNASHGITTTNIGEGSNLYFTNARARAAISGTGSLSYNSTTGVMSFTMPAQNSDNITEGTSNLYFTNARVGSYLSSNGYATQSTVIAAITDSAPSTLDTLNELAAALGDDANFSTTVTNSIATKLPLTGGALTGAVTTNSTFDGVDIAVRDGVLTSTTTTANAALPKAGGAMTGAITTNSTFDGRNVSVDGTKLDTIETSADVTDTTNVTAAGALMDSEITNLAQVKAFDSSDYATAAQGTTADSALQNIVEDTTPQLGGDLASNGNDILFADNDKAIFGTGSDLRIYHDGFHSYIYETGSGDLRIRGINLQLQNDAGENYLSASNNGEVTLYYDNAAKLATTTTGIDVTGTATMDGLVVDSTTGFSWLPVSTAGAEVGVIGTGTGLIINTPSVNSGYGSGLAIDGSYASALSSVNIKAFGAKYASYGSELNLFTSDDTSLLKRQTIASNGDISFYEDTGTTAQMTWDASADALTFTDNTKATFGDSNEFSIHHNTNGNTYIGGGTVVHNSNTWRLMNMADTEAIIKGNADGDVKLYYNGSEKLATTTTGIDVTGAVVATSFSDGTISGITFIDEDSFATNSATRIPTQQSIKAYVDTQVAGVVDSAPAALDTLNELAAALGDDANFSTTTTTALGNRLRVDTAAQGLTGTQQANATTNLGITATKAELNYVDGVTSSIQTQLNGKQASGSYLTGNQTITLSGDVSGSGTTSIAVTIADDSHNHVISNVDGLQTALDAKLPLAGGTLTGALIVNKAAESLANQPSIISTFDSSGTDGLALISIEHLTNSTASALGAGLRFQVGDGSTGTADKQSYIFQRGGSQLPLVYIADRSHEFYVDHHDNNIDGTSYSDYGTLALTLNEAGNVVATGTVTATGGNSSNWNTAYGWGNHASASYATETYVGTQISNLVDSSPAALNTLNELAAALGDDANFSTTVTNSIATKLPLAGGTMTGTLAMGANAITSTGTISSGAITSTGYVTSSNAKFGVWSDSGAYSGIFHTSHASSSYGMLFDATNTFVGSGTGGSVYIRYNNNTSANQLVVNSSGWSMGSTVVMDGSRNLVNIGTISSGAITSSGHIQSAGALKVTETGTAQVIMIGNQDSGGTNTPAMIMGVNGRLKFGYGNSWSGEGGTFTEVVNLEAGNLDISTGGLELGGQTVIDSSRNLTNIGNITVSGTVDGRDVATDGAKLDGIAAGATNTVTNATHTGEVTGSGALTIANDVVDAGNLKVTGNGTTAQFLRSDGDGTFTWATPTDTNTTYSAGTGLSLTGTTFANTSPNIVQTTITGNAGTATTLQTARTINGVSFNGSANITVADSTKLPLAGGTVTGELNITSNTGVTGSSAPSYTNAKLEVQTSDNNVPAIAFHRGGYSATALYEYDGELYANAWTTRGQTGKLISTGNIGSYAWTSSNDGPSSGLDADTVDGIQGASFLRGDATDAFTTLSGTQLTANLHSANSGVDNGFTFWGTAETYSIKMGNNQTDHGTVTDYSMHHNMGTTAGRGFTFGSSRTAVTCSINALTGAILSSNNITAYSDIRIKDNIEVIPNALDKVSQLSGYTFTRTDVEDKEKKYTGVLAQEVLKVLPEAVQLGATEKDTMSVAYGNMVGLLIESIKELKTEVDDLKKQLKEIK
jgi:hypothetical protein